MKAGKDKFEHWPLAAVMAAGLLLRLINLGAEPYWGDEVLSLDISTHFDAAREMVRYVRQVEFHPPLYYLILRPWVALFGASELATRAISVGFGLATIAAVYALAMALFRKRTAAVVAALVVAVMPMQIEFSQEARPYSMVCFAGALAALALWKHLRTGRAAWAVVYVAATVFGLYLSYSYILVAAAMAGWWVVEAASAPRGRRTRTVLNFLAVHAVVFVAFYPWLDAFLAKLLLSQYDILGTPRPKVDFRQIGFFGAMFDQLVWLTKARAVLQINLLAQFIFKVAFLAAGAVAAARILGARAKGSDGHPVAFVAWSAAVPAALFMLSPLSIPYAPIYVRQIIFVTVPIALGLGLVVAELERRKAVALVSLFLVTLIPSVTDIAGNDALWDSFHRLAEAGEFIDSQYKEGDLVIINTVSGRSDLSHYLRPEITVVPLLPLEFYGNDIWSSRATLGLIENESQVRYIPAVKQSVSGGQALSETTVARKLDNLYRIHRPKRVWLYGFTEKDDTVLEWFSSDRWRRAYSAIGDLFPLYLFDGG